jgi:NitT/TauT family transport system permease protein
MQKTTQDNQKSHTASNETLTSSSSTSSWSWASLEWSLPWLVVIGFVVMWELGVRLFNVPEFQLPAPSVAVAALWQFREVVAGHAVMTLLHSLGGFLIAVVAGLLLGVVIGSSRLAYKALYPVLVGFNSVPKAALVPALVIWFGIGTVPAIITAFLISFFPIVVNVATGLATVEPELQDVLRALGANKTDMVLKVGLPRAMPYFFASLKVSITLAFVGAVIVELSNANNGLGYLMTSAVASFNTPLVYACLLVLAFFGVVFYEMFAFLERKLVGWAYRGSDG